MKLFRKAWDFIQDVLEEITPRGKKELAVFSWIMLITVIMVEIGMKINAIYDAVIVLTKAVIQLIEFAK